VHRQSDRQSDCRCTPAIRHFILTIESVDRLFYVAGEEGGGGGVGGGKIGREYEIKWGMRTGGDGGAFVPYNIINSKNKNFNILTTFSTFFST